MSLVQELCADPESRAEELAEEATRLGTRAFVLDGREVADAAAFHAALAALLSFPAYYGMNFDALDECITDLAWLDERPRRLIFLRPERFEHGDERSFAIATAILDDATRRWESTNTPLDVVYLRAASKSA